MEAGSELAAGPCRRGSAFEWLGPGLAACSFSLLLRARFKLVNFIVIFLGIIFEGGKCKYKISFSLVFMNRFVYLCITNTCKHIRLVVSVF